MQFYDVFRSFKPNNIHFERHKRIKRKGYWLHASKRLPSSGMLTAEYLKAKEAIIPKQVKSVIPKEKVKQIAKSILHV